MKSRKHFYSMVVMSLLVALSLILGACARQAEPGVPGTGSGTAGPGMETAEPSAGLGSYEDLVAALREAGAAVELAGEVQEPFFGNRTQNLTVNGENVQVFEFADTSAREAAAATISGNGFIIGTSMVDWIATPYFFVRDELIVLYVGENQSMLDLLKGLLGDPITGMQPAPQGEGTSGGGLSSTDELKEALEAAGAVVEPAGDVEQPFFEVRGKVLKVNDEDVQVFEFADEAAREAAASTISANGFTIGPIAIDWVSQPYFFSNGRLIALYVGENPSKLELLSLVMGAPITQKPAF